MEIVTGKAGVPHVSSADDGRRIAGEVGTGSYVLQTGGKLAPSLVDANTVRIATGDMIVQGRHIGVTAPEDVKVASGSQGKKRMDYICVHYTRDVSGSSPTLVEKVEWKVLQGAPGSSAVAPSVPKGSILVGDADVTVPICSVTFDGLTTGQPKLLIPELTPLADLGDSVSPAIVDCNIANVTGIVCKVGNIVVVTLSGTLKSAVSNWGMLTLSNAMPRAKNRYNSLLISQDTTDPRILLSVSGTELFIESKGASMPQGTWTFGQLVYVCE